MNRLWFAVGFHSSRSDWCSFRPDPGQSLRAVETYVKSEMDRQHIPGFALLVSRDGKIVRAQGFGFSNVEHRVAVKPETVFQSGSVGKQFTATAIMMLVEEGKIGLDDSITKYFPEGSGQPGSRSLSAIC